MTWEERMAARIERIHANLPADATLADRVRALAGEGPGQHGGSWPQKAWQKARRKYLVRYGYEPRTKPKVPGQREMFDALPRDPVTGRPVV